MHAPTTTHSTRPVTSDTIEVLNDRVSVRAYRNEPVDQALVDTVLRAAFRAPTSSNIQAYSVVQVHDAGARKELAAAAGNQQHIIACPVYLTFCADLTRMEEAFTRNGHDISDNNLELGLVSTIDASLVGMSAYLAADSVGLKGVMIGGMRNDPERVARILGLPNRVYCVFGLCLGYADSVPAQKPRMNFDALVHHDRFNTSGTASGVDAYDSALAQHYRSTGRDTNDASWTHEIDTKFSTRPRDGLRGALSRLGFDFR